MSRRHEHVDLILELVKLFKPKTYVELGVQHGHTFNAVTALKVVENAIAVDLKIRGIKMRPGVDCYEMSTQKFISLWEDPIDMLFIDADHSYYQVKNDFFKILDKVRRYTGLVLLHDTYPLKELAIEGRCGDAWKFAKELHEFYRRIEIVTLPGPTAGMSIVRIVGLKHMEWEDEI